MSDILEDQKIHYIVKDYKRMFEQHQTLLNACKKYQSELQKADNRIRDLERQVENLKNTPPPLPPTPKQSKGAKARIVNVENQIKATISKLEKRITVLNNSLTELSNLKTILNS